MSGLRIIHGTAVALPQTNIDTDQLIPARFMSRPRSEGYGDFLMHDARQQMKGHPLDCHKTSVLVAGRNFGSGSSREAAVYALVDYGIQAVFAPSFGDIFAANATNNGLLAARVSEEVNVALNSATNTSVADAMVNLPERHARIGTFDFRFEIDDVSAEKLINGWDDIDLTGKFVEQIRTFRAQDQLTRPWAKPSL